MIRCLEEDVQLLVEEFENCCRFKEFRNLTRGMLLGVRECWGKRVVLCEVSDVM